mgnify:CR=1 FL=1
MSVPRRQPEIWTPANHFATSDPCSRRVSCLPVALCSPASRPGDHPRGNRRGFLALLGGGLILPAFLSADSVSAAKFVSEGVDPAKLWDGDRQLVFAYKAGEELGEDCQRLEDVKDDLPVSLLWRMPPDWVKVFPTIHFEVSTRRWKKYDGWQDAEHFIEYYSKFNPPPKSRGEDSPYKQYAAEYDGPEWTYPGEIDDHLLDPNQPHHFSRYELQGLSKREMENLHAAHHEERIEPGVRPPVRVGNLAAS